MNHIHKIRNLNLNPNLMLEEHSEEGDEKPDKLDPNLHKLNPGKALSRRR